MHIYLCTYIINHHQSLMLANQRRCIPIDGLHCSRDDSAAVTTNITTTAAAPTIATTIAYYHQPIFVKFLFAELEVYQPGRDWDYRQTCYRCGGYGFTICSGSCFEDLWGNGSTGTVKVLCYGQGSKYVFPADL